jgi:hypothetical protein
MLLTLAARGRPPDAELPPVAPGQTAVRALGYHCCPQSIDTPVDLHHIRCHWWHRREVGGDTSAHGSDDRDALPRMRRTGGVRTATVRRRARRGLPRVGLRNLRHGVTDRCVPRRGAGTSTDITSPRRVNLTFISFIYIRRAAPQGRPAPHRGRSGTRRSSDAGW